MGIKKKVILTATAASILTGVAIQQEILVPSVYATDAKVMDKATWIDHLKKYLNNDHQYIKSYPGFHFDKNEIILGENQSSDIQLLDDKGNPVEHDVEWYVFTTVPYDNFFSAVESREDLAPENHGGEVYQKASLVKINENNKEITARKMVGKQDTLKGWLVAVYQGEYAHLLPIKVIKESQAEHARLVDEKAAEILDQMKDLSDPDKVVFAYQYLVEHIDYDTKYYGRPSQYNSLVLGKAVCEGYARAFKYLMDKSGIICEYETGDIKSSGAQGESLGALHAWNRVKIEGKWYYVDVTWGDSSLTGIDYNYLFASKEFMEKSRVVHDTNEDLGTKYLNYGLPKEVVDLASLPIPEQVKEARDSLIPGQNKVKIYIPYSEDPNKKQYQVRDMFVVPGQYIAVEGLTPLKTFPGRGVLYEYTVVNNIDINQYKRSTDITISYELVDASQQIVKLTFDKDIDLQPYNIFLSSGKVASDSLKKLSNREYTIQITDNHDQIVNLQVQKSNYKVLSDKGQVTLAAPDEIAIPEAVFTGESMNTGYLSNLSETAEYNLGDGIWRKATNEPLLVSPNTAVDYENQNICARIFVRNKVGNHYSNAQEIKITRPLKEPAWIKLEKSEGGNLVKFVTGTEYSVKDTNHWIATTQDTLENLAKGTYEFRIKGTNNTFASASYQLTIDENPTKEPIVTTKEVPFSTSYQADDTIDVGTKQVAIAGKNGVETTTTTYHYNKDTAAFDEKTEVVTTPAINQVVKVGTKAKVTTKVIPFETVRQASQDMYVGAEKVLVAGVNGLLTETTAYQVNETTGEVSELLTTTDKTKEPVPQIIIYGTKEKDTSVNPTPEEGNGTTNKPVTPEEGDSTTNKPATPEEGNGTNPDVVHPQVPESPNKNIGWQGDYYYNKYGQKARNEWIYDENYHSWFYLNPDGRYAHNQWVGSYYLKDWGYMAKEEWIYDEDYHNWFFINENGSYAHDIWKDSYYLTQWGEMAKNGWAQSPETGWHYFDSEGKYIQNQWVGDYYLKDWGYMAKQEWIYDENYHSWFYLKADGKYARNEWVNGYYLHGNGAMAHNEWIYDENYQNWFFVGDNGYYLHDTWVGSYYIKSNGEMARNEWIHDGSAWYYLKQNGQYAHDEWINSYYLNHDGKLTD
ncbi:Glucan-binding domain-containing protein (YG repeat) [Granulicatella balaenopterae]|uniref:Glucan-binding domain-containing protein (YG repeat) n=1 Tax=Granulicatella balaenopterae TaxID=137733 RepID=A0A1H9N501_9LACT|nr:G5 domain-containing protein [Granulicatella balaenopterae]SER30749.1 Glucan-binding domain-containing protein (YG repeat) [Granulicatella balaenopterae]